jgi:hypothetical protein
MKRPRKFYPKVALRVVLLYLLVAQVFAQTPAKPPGNQNPPGSPVGQITIEKKISPEEAQELFRQVDEILQFASTDTGLPIKHPVKRRLTNREDLVAYMTKHMSDDEDTKRLRRSELVLKKFGLIPAGFDLGNFLVALLREQVAGYYDPKSKTVNLLDWVGVEQQRPVLAHELTHALQDQSFGLDKWMRAGAADLAERRKEPTPQDIENDEISTVRQALVEGQAMAVLVDYMLAPSGRTLVNSPEVVAALEQGMMTGTADSVQFHNAPIFLKESLTFPYHYGLDFEAAVLPKRGKDGAFAGVLRDPPHSTRQIMEPETYLSGERIAPMPLPDFKQDFKSYERFDIGAMGEFDVAVLLDQYAGQQASHQLYPQWRGGYYSAVLPKGKPDGPVGLLYVSRWSSPEHAAEFAAIYAKSIAQRYQHAQAIARGGVDPVPDLTALSTLTGNHAWQTEDGQVVIEVKDDTVMVTESLAEATTATLEQQVLGAPAAAKSELLQFLSSAF